MALNDTPIGAYIRPGDKYAALALSVKTDDSVVSQALGGLQLIAGASFPLDDFWRKQLGSRASEDLESCDSFLIARLASERPGVLDGESQTLQLSVHNAYLGLLMTGPWAPAHRPLVLTGAREADEIVLRQHQALDGPVPGIITAYPAIAIRHFAEAARLAKCLSDIPAAGIKGGHWRLWRTLDIFRNAVAIRDLVERVHQYCRCIDGLILPGVGKTAAQFKSRTELFIGPKHHPLMETLYEIRSADEHLNETKYLEVFDRDVRLDVLQKEMIVSYMVRRVLFHLIGTPHLWEHFGNAVALEAFWKLEPADRQKIWGDPIDPLAPVAKFDPAEISDGQLGAQ